MAAGGGAPGGFDYNAWAAQNLKNGDGGGAASGEGMTLDSVTKKGADKAVTTGIKIAAGLVGLQVNAEIEGQGIVKDTNVGSGLSLNNLSVVRETSGGGFLSVIWDALKKQTTRENPGGLLDGSEGSGSGSGGGAASGGDSGGGGGFADSGGASGSSQGGGGDFHSFVSHHEGQVSEAVTYGDKVTFRDVSPADLGSLPSPTAGIGAPSVDRGMDIG